MLDYFTKFVLKKHFQMGEILLGMFGITWGLWLLNPIFKPFEIKMLEQVSTFSSNDLGFFMLVLGILTLLLSGLDKYLLRQLVIFLNMFSWWFIALLVFVTVPANPSIAVYTMLGVYSFWQYVKLVVLIFVEKDFVGTVK